MEIIGFESYGGILVGEFLADKFEVTNKEFKRFVDSGGYNNKSYWKYPIYIDGKKISWESAINRFVDKTGKPGPGSWEVGTYPDGQENYPVVGISWYEASAYAVFVRKKLPSIYQWSVMAETGRAMNIIPMSNYNGKSTVPVGSMDGMSSYGIYDLAGNAREWCYNDNGLNGESYILGGGWNDPSYSFNDGGIQPAADRSLSNGFRCVSELPEDTTIENLSKTLKSGLRDYHKEKPVDDKTFSFFLRQFAYDKSHLNEQLVTEVDTGTLKIDLETRKDILTDKIGYFGWSWGGRMGGIIPAVEKRIKAVVLHVGGMPMQKTLPEVDQINFLPRINQPILMLNGKYDMYFPVESSQIPMFNFLGTASKDKKIIIYDTGHLVPRTDLIKETLFWYDKYLGPVK